MKRMRMTGTVVVIVVVVGILAVLMVPRMTQPSCPGSLVWCPGVGCVSGPDKCIAGSRGGASRIFSRETFVNKKCPDGTRTDGPCLLEF
jgi:hypothetical protein